jgi:hypothetical protein
MESIDRECRAARLRRALSWPLHAALAAALLLPVARIPVLWASAGEDDLLRGEHAQKTLEIYRTIVEVDTSKHTGNTPRVAGILRTSCWRRGSPSRTCASSRAGTSPR